MEDALCFWLLVFAVASGGSRLVDAADYDYEENGPDTWPSTYPTCNGSSQSPIDILQAAASSSTLTSLTYQGHWTSGVEATLTNNGHTAEVTVKSWTSPATLSGGILQGTYVFSNMHFHWGANSSVGSEHTLDGQSYSMEAHVVHYKQDYGNVTYASTQPDGIAVVGVFLQAGMTANSQLSDLAAAVPLVTTSSSATSLDLRAATLWFHDRAAAGGYYTYQGSLTTPPCSEAVTWIVYPLPVSLSEGQVSGFRSLKSPSGTLLTTNYRPTQELGDRKVQYALTSSDVNTLNHVGEGYVRA